MSASAIYFLDIRGKVLISRNYRGDINMSVIDKFMPALTAKEEEGNFSTPIIETSECTFIYTKHNNLHVVLTTNKNANVTLMFVLLYKIVNVMKMYFKELEEESIKDNFVIIYELLDEIIDFGYPQTTDTNILQEYITQESHKLEVQRRIPVAVTNAISWRSEGIIYKRNEIFLDILEYVNILTNSKGSILRNDIIGSIQMKVFLSGMPELQLELNDKFLICNEKNNIRSRLVELEDVKFHQCVRLSKYEHDRMISFIPPDGEFELMSYRISSSSKPPLLVEHIVSRHEHSRVEYMVKVKSHFKRLSTAKYVELIIPVPTDADSPKFQTTMGKVIYLAEHNAILWRIKSFPGGREYIMKASFKLPSIDSGEVEKKRPIAVRFEIPYFTCSGIQANHLKVVEKSGCITPLPWVRYITKNGEYQLRTN